MTGHIAVSYTHLDVYKRQPYDRALCTRLGAAAAQAIIDEDYGYMIAMINDKTKRCV